MSDAAAGRVRRAAVAVLLAPCPASWLVVGTMVPVAVAAWWLLSPPLMVLRQGPVDLLFNLAGAWRVYNGQIPHVDFHEPVGQLNFRLTALGFHLLGPNPRAFLVGELLMLAAVLPVAMLAAWRRLPAAAALSFVLFASLPIIIPTNIGSELDAFSFAMSYNRYGWSAISVLSLMLFIPTRDQSRLDLLDAAGGALLLFGMFYVKISFFLVGLAALALALVICPHVRARRYAWAGAGVLAVANALLPHSHPYLIDLWRAATDGGLAVVSPGSYVRSLLSNAPEYSLCGLGATAGTWMWWRGLAPLRVPVAAAFLIAACMLLVVHNTQLRGVPLGTVIAYVLYSVVAPRGGGRLAETLVVLAALLIYPALSIAAYGVSLAAYSRAGTERAALRVIDRSNLLGLAVPLGGSRSGEGIRQFEYLDTIVEAARLFPAERRPRGPVMVLDSVNPLPFALGLPSPRGGDLFLDVSAPLRVADEMFADAGHVLVPKQPASARLTDKALVSYGPYLEEHFPVRQEHPHWTLLSRR